MGAAEWISLGGVLVAAAALIVTMLYNRSKEQQNQGNLVSQLQGISDTVQETRDDVKALREETQENRVAVATMGRDIKTLYNNQERMERQVDTAMNLAQAVNRLADAVAGKVEHQ